MESLDNNHFISTIEVIKNKKIEMKKEKELEQQEKKMERLEILKTYKIYIGGQFPRTESGRYYDPKNAKGEALANICLSSRKDLRNAVSAARKAFGDLAAGLSKF